MIGFANDLDRAAFKRLVRVGVSVDINVDDLYIGVFMAPMLSLIRCGIAKEVFRSILDAAVTMVYTDIDRRDRGQESIGGAQALLGPFVEALGGDEQFAYHICRITLFGISGVVGTGLEAETRDLLESLDPVWDAYKESLK